ncbi:MAG: VWA domain-containing protein, partial [Bdellovibrionales bacterium]|nr:VWA domain-containing protein [Bdellovibrionales bacterium]
MLVVSEPRSFQGAPVHGVWRPLRGIICISLWIGILSTSFSYAQDKASEVDEVSEKESVDAVLLLDASASMRLTDPDRLRDDGAALFLQFLKEGDRLAIVEFDSTARVLRPLTRYHPIQDPEIKDTLHEVSDTGLYTDLVAGVVEAKRLLEADPRPSSARTIILLSDGKLDPDPEVATAEGLKAGLVYTLLPELKQKGIILHTLALSEQSDKELLAQMAQATDGMSWYSESPEGIHEAFKELFLVVKKPQLVPQTSKGFRIDGEVQEATFYINKDGLEDTLTLRAPSGAMYEQGALGPGMEWFEGQEFITVTIDEPEAGMWQVIGLLENRSFATVLTNLKLITDWPATVTAGSERVLRARLYDDERPVVLPEMTSVTTYTFQIIPTDRVSEPVARGELKDNGEDSDEKADDGVFSAPVLIETQGDYQLLLLAKAPTFERQQTLPFRVKPRLVNLSVVAVEDVSRIAVGSKIAASVDYFRVTLNPEVENLSNLEVQLLAKDSKKNLFDLDVKKRTDGSLRYEVPASALLEEGEYELQAIVTGETKKKKVRGTSQVVYYTRKITEEEKEGPVTHLVTKTEPEKPPEPPYLLFSLLILGLNVGTTAFCVKKLKSGGSQKEEALPDLVIDEKILSALVELEEKVSLREVNLD